MLAVETSFRELWIVPCAALVAFWWIAGFVLVLTKRERKFSLQHTQFIAKAMTQSVAELEAKIKFLARSLNTSESGLLGPKRETVRSGYRTNRLNDDIELELAQKCGFDLGWPEWRKGTKHEFEDAGRGGKTRRRGRG